MQSAVDPRLARLLEHPALWRGRSAARSSTVPTGFAALDAALPGAGWPQVGLVEILISRLGVGELYLILPALASLTQRLEARWCAWIAPRQPFAHHARSSLEPFAPALAAHGVNFARVLIVRTESPLWACEQALRSGACDAAVAWMQRVPVRALRRLQLAAERGRTLFFLFRGLSTRAVREPSVAVLRITVQPLREGARIDILKSRGSPRGAICLSLHEAPHAAAATK
ncbi:MAG: translesion DNA synthesis-associated protein ImuA [Steroidobacteraceae bacterium]